MKRIKAACLCQTLHFMLKEDVLHSIAAKAVKDEVEQYKQKLNKSNTKYKILEEKINDDDSITIKIVKQYNQSPVGNYLD
jgi:hypothetical protein